MAKKYFLEAMHIFQKYNTQNEIAQIWNDLGILEFNKKIIP